MLKLCHILAIVFFALTLIITSAAQTRTFANKTDVEELLTKVLEAIEANDLGRANSSLQRALATAPRNVSVQTLAGVFADRQNDLATAEKHFALAAQLAPKSSETRNNYGAVLLKQKRQAEAAKEFAASLTINPNQSSALVNLGQIRFAEGNLKVARELFERAKTVAPDTEVLRALVAISLQLNENKRAAEEFKEYFAAAKNNFDSIKSAKTHSTSAVAADSNTALGNQLLKNSLLDEAQQELELVVANDANSIDALILLARVYLQQKNVSAAGRLLESKVAQGIESAKIYAALADVYQAAGRVENAIPAMRLAIEKEPRDESYRARYGWLLIEAKAPAAATIRLTEAVTEFPRSARLWLALGIAQQTEGNVVAAQNSFEKSLAIEPDSILALAYLSNVYTEQANYGEAIKTYKRAVAIEPNSAVLNYLLADALLKIPASRAEEIEKYLRKSATLDSKFAPTRLALGKIYVRREAWQAAADEFAALIKFAPDLAEAHYQLGRALARLKRIDESKVAFAQYKKLSESQTAQKELDRRALVRQLTNVKF